MPRGPAVPSPGAAPTHLPPSTGGAVVMPCGVREADLSASPVVFLVALPLCIGVAVASGVPAEPGLVTGVVAGRWPGRCPAAAAGQRARGRADRARARAVQSYGLDVLGALVLGSGLVQLALGAVRLGRWFRAVSASVVQGMLAGTGLVLVAGQVYALGDVAAPASGLSGPTGLVTPPRHLDPAALTVGGATVLVLVLRPRRRRGAPAVPAPLLAVGPASPVTAVLDLPVRPVEVRGLPDAVRPPTPQSLGRLTEVGALGTVVAFALIASAESLFSAAAVDRPPRAVRRRWRPPGTRRRPPRRHRPGTSRGGVPAPR